jgi:hypothetical protein
MFKVEAIQEYLVKICGVCLCVIVSLCTLISLFCFKGLATQVPTNYVLFGVSTLCEAVLVGIACSFYDSLTAPITVAMTSDPRAISLCDDDKTDFTTFQGVKLVIPVAEVKMSLMMVLFLDHAGFLLSAILCIVHGVYLSSWIR